MNPNSEVALTLNQTNGKITLGTQKKEELFVELGKKYLVHYDSFTGLFELARVADQKEQSKRTSPINIPIKRMDEEDRNEVGEIYQQNDLADTSPDITDFQMKIFSSYKPEEDENLLVETDKDE